MASFLRLSLFFAVLLLASCAGTSPDSNPYSNRLMAPSEVIREHLRAMEAGEWEKAETYLSEDFKMKVKGVPLASNKKNALDFHKAFFQAFPDLKFNEEILKEDKHLVELRIRITGTHLGVLNSPDASFEKLQPSGKKIDLPYQNAKYKIRFNQIESISGEGLQGIDMKALEAQLKSDS